MNRCEMCGIPAGTMKDPGYTAEIIRRAENNYKSSKKTTVWCCSESCGVQALAISQYGGITSRWPITLKQCYTIFRRQLCQVKN